MITIEKIDLSLIDNIEPNFTQRRLDFESPEETELLKISADDKYYYIPIRTHKKNCDISVELTEIPEIVFKQLIKWIFKHYNEVKKINFLESLNNYTQNTFSCSTNAYKTILPDSKEEYLMSLHGRIRYNYVSKKRHLEKAYQNIEIKKYENIDNELIQKYFELKKITYGKEYGFTCEEYICQYHITEAYELLADGETAAIVLLSVINENIYVENVTYNRKFSKYSPGICLLIEMILNSIENPKYKNIFWGAYNDYKKHLSNKTYNVYDGSIYRSVFSYRIKQLLNFLFQTYRENGRKVFVICKIPLNTKIKF